MADSFPFAYRERFSLGTIRRMPESLKVIGTSIDSDLLLILRLLSGAIILEHKKTAQTIKPSENYFSSDYKGYSQHWAKKFPTLIGDDYTTLQLSEFVSYSKRSNRKFYRNILSELSYYLYYKERGAQLSAFLFLYRTLEHVSFAFPAIYASKTTDFRHSYKQLKSLMSGEKNQGELAFFKKFVNTIYKDDPIIESSINFEINAPTINEQEMIFRTLRELCSDSMISASTNSPRILAINYPEVGSFLITVRNRFFHFLNGSVDNVESSKIEDMDHVFELLNRKFAFWLSSVFLAVISTAAIEYETIRNS